MWVIRDYSGKPIKGTFGKTSSEAINLLIAGSHSGSITQSHVRNLLWTDAKITYHLHLTKITEEEMAYETLTGNLGDMPDYIKSHQEEALLCADKGL